MRVDVCLAHTAAGTTCCLASALVARAAGLPSMVRSPPALMQCSCACALLHALVAAYGRVERVHRTERLPAFWSGVLVSTWAWVAVQHSLPRGAFIMLSAEGLQSLSVAGWMLLCGCAGAVSLLVHHHAQQVALQRQKHGHVQVCTGVATLLLVMAVVAGPGFHLHHYMWAPAVALGCQCDTWISMTSQSIALGIMNQELAFGHMPPFYDAAAPPSTSA